MDDSILEKPVWSALTSVHRSFSLGTDLARRFQPDVSPFGAAINDSDASLSELGRLVRDHGPLVVAQSTTIQKPPGARIANVTMCEQMHLVDLPESPDTGHTIEPLGEEDVEAIRSLADLTKPGPFAERTHLLGDYWGIRSKGSLVAMVGERLKQHGFVEISGVCTHPDHRGHGYALSLCADLTQRIVERGERPYLHVYNSAKAAKNLYLTLGFGVRRPIAVTMLEPD
jgi:predicted GNAT family acetyltransferase